MRTRVSRALAVSLVFFALACGKPQAPPTPGPAESVTPAPPTRANTGQLTVHVKGMTKELHLV